MGRINRRGPMRSPATETSSCSVPLTHRTPIGRLQRRLPPTEIGYQRSMNPANAELRPSRRKGYFIQGGEDYLGSGRSWRQRRQRGGGRKRRGPKPAVDRTEAGSERTRVASPKQTPWAARPKRYDVILRPHRMWGAPVTILYISPNR